MEENIKLTPKERLFCEYYLVDLNGTQAAKKAGYSEISATEIASQNLRKLHIQKYIETRQKEIFLKLGISQERILQEYARIAFSDPRKLYKKDSNTLLNISELDDDTAAVVSSVETNELYDGVGDNKEMIGYAKKIKMWDKKGALDSLSKHFGMIVEKIDVTSKGDKLNSQEVIEVTLNVK